jgi:hypothetical protein
LLKQVKDEDLTPPKTLNVSNTSPSKNLAFKSSSWSNSKNNLSSANLSLYKLYFKYQIMDDVDLKQQLKILLNNASKTDVDIDSKQDLLDAYTTVIQSFVTPLVTLKKATDDYAKYNKKVSALVNDGSAELYTALTEYLYRNYKKDLVTGFDNYDGLEIRNDYGFMIGFLEKYPLGSSESDGVSSLYESVVMKLIDDDINPTTIFDGDIIKELEKKAEEIEEQEDFDALFEITNNSEATSTQAAYSEQRVKEVLLTGKMTVGDVEPLRLYAQDMIDNGKLSNAKIAINALAAFNEDVTALSEELKTKQGIIIPKSYYETSDMPIYQVAVKYLDMTKEDALKMTDAELVYKGLAVIVSNLSSQKALTREDANFLNDAVFPYMLARINVLTGTLGKVSTGKGERTRTENVLLSYVLGVNVLSEVLLAAPGTVTMGLRDYSPDSFKAKRDYAFDKAKEAITDKTKFDACLDDHDDYNKLYDFEDDVKADLFIKGY